MADTRRRDVEEQIDIMAQKDPNFRKELIKNPRGALEKLFGAKLPADVNFEVHEEDPKTIHIVLPAAQKEQARAAAAGEAIRAATGGGSWSSCGKELTCYGPTC